MTVVIDLGLPHDASERDIRRAYAQRLKQIDPATQADVFQALRQVYEESLARARREQALTPEEPRASLPPPTTPASLPLKDLRSETKQLPVDDVKEVLEEFLGKVRLSLRSEDEVAQALASALDDSRLVRVDAVQRFENGVVLALVQGWQPGHEFLLSPAATRFEWSADIGRLRRLGGVGSVLSAALTEKKHFFAQKQKAFETYMSLMSRLRDPTDPSRRLLIEDMPLLHLLIRRYPRWLPMVASRTNVQRWLALYDELPESAKLKIMPGDDDEYDDDEAAVNPMADFRWVSVWAWIAAILLIAEFLGTL